jgi:hypothetical protein
MPSGISQSPSASGDRFTGQTVEITMTITTSFPVTQEMYDGTLNDADIIAIEEANLAADPLSYVEMAATEGDIKAVVTVVRRG